MDHDRRAGGEPSQAGGRSNGSRAARVEYPSRAAGVPGWLERHGVRLDPGRRGAVAVGLAALLAAGVAGWWLLAARPHASAVLTPPTQVASAAVSPSASGPPPAAAVPAATGRAGISTRSGSASVAGPALVVDVVGRVRRPGVYRLPPGARVDDAVRVAGGVLPGTDLTGLNLARKLLDGEQIAVGVAGAPAGPAPATGSSGGADAPAAPVDLNSATLEQLDALPGVGPVLAQHILDWRAAHGRFDTVDQLNQVSGIGPAKFADLRPLVTV